MLRKYQPNRYGKMPCGYDTYHDLEARLSGCIVKYRDHPFFCSVDSGGNGKGRLFISRLGDIKRENLIEVKVTDPDLDISSTELGYFNIKKGEVVYIQRAASKIFKQGIHPDYLRYYDIDGKSINDYRRQGTTLFNQKSMYDGLMGVYPDVTIALETEGCTAVAPDVAIQTLGIGIALVYLRTQRVGYFDDKSRFVVSPRTSEANKKYVERFDWRT